MAECGRLMMIVLRILWAMLFGGLALGVARAQDGGSSVRFSIYLAGAVDGGEPDKTLSVVRDLHYALGERNIPLYLKQFRQSIEFPYQGPRSLSFFRVESVDGELVRKVVCETRIPPGARKGVLVMVPEEGGARFKLRPFWVQASGLKKGSGLVYNLSGNSVGLVVDGNKRVGLKEGNRLEISGRFKSGEEFGYSKLEAFLSRERRGKMTAVKVLSRTVMIPKNDTGLFLLIPKQGDYLSVIPLMASGVSDPDREADLKKELPPPSEGAPGEGVR